MLKESMLYLAKQDAIRAFAQRNAVARRVARRFVAGETLDDAIVVAHELNNIVTIIQGYADRLLLKHGENPALETHLKLISEAARRATAIVRDASPPDPSVPIRSQPVPTPPPPSVI